MSINSGSINPRQTRGGQNRSTSLVPHKTYLVQFHNTRRTLSIKKTIFTLQKSHNVIILTLPGNLSLPPRAHWKGYPSVRLQIWKTQPILTYPKNVSKLVKLFLLLILNSNLFQLILLQFLDSCISSISIRKV